MKYIKNTFFLFIILFSSSTFLGQTYTIQIGAGTGTTTSGVANPYVNNYDNRRSQFIITAAELVAAGAPKGGQISSVAFQANANGGNKSINLTIGLKNSSTSEWGNPDLNLSASWESSGSFTYIYNSSINTNAVSGWKYYGTSTFCWDGSSNIIVQVSNTGGASGTTAARIYYSTSKGSPCQNTNHWAYGGTACCGNGSGTGSSYVPPDMMYYDNDTYRPNVRLVITPTGGCPANGTIPTSTTALCQVLPIELTSFTASSTTNNSNEITWTTASEKNNDYFTLEKSNAGEVFEALVKIKGSGNSISEKKYSYIDTNPQYGTTYYRLKQTDYDRTFKYSDIISILSNPKKTLVNNIFPNPTNNSFFIEISSPIVDDAEIILFDNLGRILYSNKKAIDIGITAIEIETSDLPIGIYTCKILFNKTGENSIHKIIKN